jgi:hypothetical protein
MKTTYKFKFVNVPFKGIAITAFVLTRLGLFGKKKCIVDQNDDFTEVGQIHTTNYGIMSVHLFYRNQNTTTEQAQRFLTIRPAIFETNNNNKCRPNISSEFTYILPIFVPITREYDRLTRHLCLTFKTK